MADTTNTVDNVVHPEMVSGSSIFWSLVAIVSHAMLQVSFTGYTWNGNSFQYSLWPHRSSPFICLLDGVADGYLCLRVLFSHDAKDEGREPSSLRNGSLTKIALFILGVLPQATKLFAVRGIPKSVNWLKVIVSICGWVPHLIGTYAFCYGFVDRVGFSASDNIVNAVDWLFMFTALVFLLYISQHILFTLFNKRSPVPRYPILVLLVCTNFCGIPDLVGIPGKRIKKRAISRWQVTLQHLISLGLACYLCAGLLYCIVGWLYSFCIGSLSSESSRTANRTETPVLNQTATTQTETQGLAVVPSSELPHNGLVESLQQPLALPDQASSNADNEDVAENTVEPGNHAIAATTRSVREATRNDTSAVAAPSWRQRTWERSQHELTKAFVSVFIFAVT